MVKININESVLFAATERIDWAFDNFSHVCISFSGEGFHRITPFGWLHCQKEKKKFSVLFIDWEVQFNYTIKHVESMRELYKDIVSNFYWVALPLKTVSGVSRFQPEWLCWDPAVSWVRVPHFCYY